MAEGFGEWDNTVTNPGNPQRRDTVWVQAAKDKDTPAYVVLQFDQDNPGVWPFHCTYHLPPPDLFPPPPSPPSIPLSPAPPSAFPTPCLPHNSPSSPFLSLSNIPLTFHHHRSHSLARIRRPLRLHPRTPRRHSQKHEDTRCNGAEL